MPQQGQYTIEAPSASSTSGSFFIDIPQGQSDDNQPQSQGPKYTIEPPPQQQPKSLAEMFSPPPGSSPLSAPPAGPYPEWYERFLEKANKVAEWLGPKEGAYLSAQGSRILKEQTANPESNIPGGPSMFSPEGPVPEGFRTPGFSQVPIGVAGGVGGTMGGMVGDFRNWPFLAAGDAVPLIQRLASGGFGVMMTHDALMEASRLEQNWAKLTPEERAEGLTQLGIGATFATGANLHAIAGGKVGLTNEEYDYLQGVIQQHLEQGLSEGDLIKVDDAVAGSSILNDKPKLTAQEMSALRMFLTRHPAEIAELIPKAEAGDIDAQNKLRAILQGTRRTDIGPPAGQEERRGIQPSVPEVPQAAPESEGTVTQTGGIGPTIASPNAPEGGVEAIRNDTGVTGREGGAGSNLSQRAVEGGDRGADTQGAAYYKNEHTHLLGHWEGPQGPVQFIGAALEPITNVKQVWNPNTNSWEEHPSNFPYGSYLIEAKGPDGSHIGELLIGLEGNGNAHVNDVQINHPYRGQGYGRAIYDQAKEVASALGADTLRSGTSGTSADAAKVWRGMGAEDLGGNRFSFPLSSEAKSTTMSTLVPDFSNTVSDNTTPIPTDATLPPNNPDSPPVISERIDEDLANGGIQVVRGGEDISWVNKYLGSITQAARRLGNPIFKAIADKIADTSIAIARNTRDSIQGYRKEVRANVNPTEWDQVVTLLNDPNYDFNNLPPNLPDNIKQAYTFTRGLLDGQRVMARDAKRQELINGGMNRAKALETIPDNWGIQHGYYVHAFPGNWTITEHGGLDANGNDIWNPITTGWRATTLSEAQAKAAEYLSQHPDSSLKVQLDNVSLPGRGISDRARLQALHDEIKQASAFIHDGENPDGVLADLREASNRLNYAPRRPALRQFSSVLQREANLPGWARDMDNFERYIIGMERYIQLAPARATILKYRNMIAQQSGMPNIMKPGEIPKRYSGDYANMLGRTDAAIEALEGYPTGFDAAIRNTLQKMGYDPNLVNSAYSTINQIEAILKLGFNPASAGLHLAQTIAATYPVLGERWTLHGILHSYDGAYDTLVHDLGIEATSNLMDIDSFQAFRGGYLGNVKGPISAVGAGIKYLSDWGLFAFSKGVETARRVSAIGAYEKGISEGLTPTQARDAARNTLIRTQFLYSPADQSIVMRNLPRPMGQFKNFTVKMMEFVYGLKGAEIPRFMAAMGVIGYAGLPFLNAISNLSQWAFNYNPENELRRYFPRFSRGALGYAGIDYTKNIGFSDWLGGHALEPSTFLGPGVSDILNLIRGGVAEGKELTGHPSRTGEEDINNAFRNISPEIRRLWDQSVRLATQPNLVDPRTGSVLIKNLSLKEQIEQLLGFTPLRVAEEKDAHEYIRNQLANVKDERGWFVDRLAETQLELMRPISEDQRMGVVKDIVTLQREAQAAGVGHNLVQAVRQRAKEMQQERLQRDLRLAPKAERPMINQAIQQYRIENP